MSGLSTHVLDTSRGRPAAGVGVVLAHMEPSGVWRPISERQTDADGRVRDLMPAGTLDAGTYRLRFEVGPYFSAAGIAAFFPFVDVHFHVSDAAQHHHVPLLVSPFGYSTYRGS